MGGRIYRFGDYRIDVAAREFCRAGQLLRPSAKVFDCTVYLIEHRERAVGRDELMAAIWGKVDVVDAQVRQVIRKVRRTASDGDESQTAVLTVPGFGYRWATAVEADFAESTATTTTTPAPQATTKTAFARSPRWHLRVIAPTLIAISAFAIVTGALAIRWVSRARVESSTTRVNAVNSSAATPLAVLPIEITADKDGAWLRLGLMELIATRLRAAGLPVLPSETVMRFVAEETSADANADRVRMATGVRDVVRAQVRRSADGWLADLRLDDPSGTRREVQAQAPDVVVAAREASDRLLVLLGRHAPTEPSSVDLPLSEITQRSAAAMLIGDLEGARRLIDAAPLAIKNQPELVHRLAQIDFHAGRLDAARERERQLLNGLSAESDPVLRARVLTSLGSASRRLGDTEEAKRAYTEAIALLRDRYDPGVLGSAYTGRAVVHTVEGHYELARTDFASAAIALTAAGDVVSVTKDEHNLAVLDMARGRYAEALPALEKAGDRFEQLGDLDDLYAPIANQIAVHLNLLDPVAAEAVSERAEALMPRLNDAARQRTLKVARASALAAIGRVGDARKLLANLESAVDATRESATAASIYAGKALLDLAGGQPESAVISARRAVAAFTTPDDAHDRATAWLCMIRALLQLGRSDEATSERQAFSQWAKTVDNPTPSLYALLAVAEQAGFEHRSSVAMNTYSEALATADREGIPADIAETVRSYGSFLIAEGFLLQASTVVGRVARWADRDFGCALLQLQLYHELGQSDAWQAALGRARALAGERAIPTNLMVLSPSSSRLESAAH